MWQGFKQFILHRGIIVAREKKYTCTIIILWITIDGFLPAMIDFDVAWRTVGIQAEASSSKAGPHMIVRSIDRSIFIDKCARPFYGTWPFIERRQSEARDLLPRHDLHTTSTILAGYMGFHCELYSGDSHGKIPRNITSMSLFLAVFRTRKFQL